MGQESLVSEQIDAGLEFVHSFSEYASIAAAFWIRPAESGDWFLYVASEDINDGGLAVAYAEVFRRLGTNKNQWLDAFQVKLLNSKDPLAAKVIEIRDRYPLRLTTRYDGSYIAGMAIDGAVIYPPITATSAPKHQLAG